MLAVHILKLRRSIESADALIAKSTTAVIESLNVLKRMRDAGF
jgi:hypothetical protein